MIFPKSVIILSHGISFCENVQSGWSGCLAIPSSKQLKMPKKKYLKQVLIFSYGTLVNEDDVKNQKGQNESTIL